MSWPLFPKMVVTTMKFFGILCLISCSNAATLGSFQFSDEFDVNMESTQKMEVWLGTKFSVGHFFTCWCPAMSSQLDWFTTVTIPDHLNTLWTTGKVPVMSWQPACYDPSLPTLSSLSNNLKTPDTFIKDVASVGTSFGNGKYDKYILSVAKQIKVFLSGPDGIYGTADDRRVYIRLGHEMNGAWYQWSVAYNKYITTTDFKEFWKRTWNLFNSILSLSNDKIATSSRIQWIWCPNNFDTGSYSAEEYYPGAQYHDWYGMDVYNPGGGAPNAHMLMTPMITRFQQLSAQYNNNIMKPIAIPEFGTDTVTSQPLQSKADWLQDFFYTARDNSISMLIQFNIDVNSVYGVSGYPTITQYATIVKQASNWLDTVNPSNIRLISDAMFMYGSRSNTLSPPTVTTTSPTSVRTQYSSQVPTRVPTVATMTTSPSFSAIVGQISTESPTRNTGTTFTMSPTIQPSRLSTTTPTTTATMTTITKVRKSVKPTKKPTTTPIVSITTPSSPSLFPALCPVYNNRQVACSGCQYCPDGSLCTNCIQRAMRSLSTHWSMNTSITSRRGTFTVTQSKSNMYDMESVRRLYPYEEEEGMVTVDEYYRLFTYPGLLSIISYVYESGDISSYLNLPFMVNSHISILILVLLLGTISTCIYSIVYMYTRNISRKSLSMSYHMTTQDVSSTKSIAHVSLSVKDYSSTKSTASTNITNTASTKATTTALSTTSSSSLSLKLRSKPSRSMKQVLSSSKKAITSSSS